MASLDTQVQYIKGVGEARAKAFGKLGVETLGDLVSFFPRAYEDRTVFKKINELIFGESVCVSATIADEPRLSRIRKGLDLVKFRAVDETGSLNITFFNQSYLKQSFSRGDSFVFFGRVGGKIGMPEMINPAFESELTAGNSTGRILPIYPLSGGLSQNMVRKAVSVGLEECGDVLPEPLPPEIVEKYHFAQARFAFRNIHYPKDYESLELARRRFVFEELFMLSCAMAMMKRGRTEKPGRMIRKQDISEFTDYLPFRLTGAQLRSMEEALSDMQSGKVMCRLVQGDVGSGKTVVAAACCWNVIMSGAQAAFMAPTEILAKQHYKTLTKLLSPYSIRITLLTGGLTAKEKREALKAIVEGETELVVGTHALISDKVEFRDLALVVADEQHRFGVEQRVALSKKGECPHILVMSATPIPRTLALIIYGEMDVSAIDERPPGRQTIDTYAVGEEMRPRIEAFIRKQVSDGRQTYIVCPMVEENEEYDESLKSVKAYAARLQDEVFPDLSIALLHGKMKTQEKDAIMSAFSAGEIDVLVSTTVIEIGVDVRNATLMVVENADRFGLSQLHQLRGRVGRGEHKSYCILFRGSDGDTSKQRLKAMCKTNDGFLIAEEDLRLRGPGDFFGKRQHGLPELRVANFATDVKILHEAKRAADDLIASDPELLLPGHEGTKRYLEMLFRKADDFFS